MYERKKLTHALFSKNDFFQIAYNMTNFENETMNDWMTRFNESSELTYIWFLPQTSFVLPQDEYDTAERFGNSAIEQKEIEVKVELNR